MSHSHRPRVARRAASAAVAAAITLPTLGQAPAAAAGCQWRYSANASGNYSNLGFDPASTPIGQLSTGQWFGARRSSSLAEFGSIDFNGDGRTDVMRTLPLGNELYRWQYRSGGSGPWEDLAFRSEPLSSLQFGDFDADGRTDVLSVEYVGTAGPSSFFRWRYSPQGTQPDVVAPFWTTASPREIAVGDFDGDRRTDVFLAEQRADGFLQYRYSPAATGATVDLAYDRTPVSQLRFGDFDADEKTDLLSARTSSNGWTTYRYSGGGATSWYDLGGSFTPLDRVRLADFDGDKRTDLLRTQTRADGYQQWQYKRAASGSWVDGAYASEGVDQMLLGQFDTLDRRADVFTSACA